MKIIDLFAGCGGLTTGFEQAGFNSVLAVEMDNGAAETYSLNHPNTTVLIKDITTIDKIIPYISESNMKTGIVGVVGGPSCQGFSLSGNRDPKDPRNSLFMDYLRIVREIKPKFFVMENVQGMLSMKTKTGEYVVDVVLKEMDDSGYNVSYDVLNAAEFGVPQARKRLIFIGIRKDLEFHKEEVLPTGWLFGENQITVEQALMDLPPIKACEGSEEQDYYSEPQNDYQRYCRNNSSKVYNHIAMRHTKRLVERFEQIKFGQSVGDVSNEHGQRQRGDATKISGKSYNQNNYRPYPNKPSPTIPASFQSNFIHPYLNRNYTAREGARLQSFPDTYIFKGKRTNMSWDKDLSQYQQIGNAVPPLLAKAIAENILKYLQKYDKSK
jgi:DNA (cytosine-5)-methyltransferase 1